MDTQRRGLPFCTCTHSRVPEPVRTHFMHNPTSLSASSPGPQLLGQHTGSGSESKTGGCQRRRQKAGWPGSEAEAGGDVTVLGECLAIYQTLFCLKRQFIKHTVCAEVNASLYPRSTEHLLCVSTSLGAECALRFPPSVWGSRNTHQEEALLPRDEEHALCGGGMTNPDPELGPERKLLDNPGT